MGRTFGREEQHGQRYGGMKTPFISPKPSPSKFATLLWWGGIFFVPLSLFLPLPHPYPLQEGLQANILLTPFYLLSP